LAHAAARQGSCIGAAAGPCDELVPLSRTSRSNWDWRTFDLDKDLELAVKNADYEALSPDLKEFKARGGKLIIYHGWNDPGPSPLNSIAYYDRVRKTVGEGQENWFRPFPDARYGPLQRRIGPDQANFFGAMERWVEAGAAPDRVTVSRVTEARWT